ncbi:MAG TPA: tetratricopeptide repeat protein [Thermoleophilaceae bacterium]
MAITRGRRASAPPADVTARNLEDLVRDRDYEGIARDAGKVLESDPDGPLAKQALLARAFAAYEYGRFGDAAADFQAAARLDPDDAWARAQALDAQYRHQGRRGRFQVQREIEELVLTGTAEPADPSDAAFLWARGRVLSGPNPDDRPTEEELGRAHDAFEQAWRIDPTSERVLGGILRVNRLMLRYRADRDQALRAARSELEDRREDVRRNARPGGALARVLRYEEGRLDIAARAWGSARKDFEAVLAEDPGHQAANVWRMYVRRMTGELERDCLLDEIDRLLRDPAHRTKGHASLHKPGPVVSPDLAAGLLTERAAILEDGTRDDLEQAAKDYDDAAAVRPGMTFAHRGALRCLIRQGEFEAAAEREALIRSFYEPAQPPGDVLVDLGRLRMARGLAAESRLSANRSFAAAIKCYRQAIRGRPDYGPAYGAKLAAVRIRGRGPDELRREAQRTRAVVEERGDSLVMAGGVRVELGRAYLALGDADSAAAAFQQCLDGPDNSPQILDHAYAGLIDAHRFDRRLAAACEAATDALERGRGVRVLGAAAWLYGELGELGRSLALYDEGLEAHPLDLRLVLGRARTLRLMGRYTTAARALEKVKPGLPEHTAARLDTERGWIAIESGELELAQELLSPRREGAARRGHLLASARAGAPDEELERIASEALEGTTGPGARAGIHLDLGRCYVERGDLTRAREKFALANAEAPQGLLLRVSEAEALIHRGALADADAAIATATEIEARYQNDPAVLATKAWRCQEAKDAEEAIAIYRRLLDEWPDNEPARIRLGLALYARGARRAGCRELKRLLEGNPGNAVAAELVGRLLLARYERNGRGQSGHRMLEDAKRWAGNARTLEERNPGAYRTLAWIALHEGHTSQAELYLDHASALRPQDAETKRDMGALHLRLHRYEEAEKCLREARAANPRDPQVPLLLGMLLVQRDDAEAAIEYFRQSVALDPCSESAQRALIQTLLRAKRPEDALRAADASLATVLRGEQLPLRLMRARVLDALARGEEDDKREALVREALRDVDACQPDEGPETADVEYHRGVLENRRGRARQARSAFKTALSADPDHAEARRALEMLGQERSGNSDEGRTRTAGHVIMAVSLLLLFGAVILGILEADNHSGLFDARWEPTIGILLVFIVVGAVLPRLTGLGFQGVVDLSVAPQQETPEPTRVVLDFVDVPLLLMSGPGDYRPPDPVIDDAGDPLGG